MSRGRRGRAKATPATGALLVARGVRKTYLTQAGPVEALRGVDLVVERGAFVAITGTSGSGKTTLLNCLAGLDRIDAGTVQLDGTDLHDLSDAQLSRWRARRLGFVFQHSNLVPVLSAVENVELPLLVARRADHRAARVRAIELLDRVGLRDRAHSRPSALSGGEQQRVAVARALVGGPAIVWADEPTGSLDTETAHTVMELLRALHAEGGTLLVVTHDASIAALAQRRVGVRDGMVVDDDLTAAIGDAAASTAASAGNPRR